MTAVAFPNDTVTLGIADDFRVTTPDAHLWATAIVKGLSKPPPFADVDLGNAIVGIRPEAHMLGSSLIQIDIDDPEWFFLDSGFLHATATPGTTVKGLKGSKSGASTGLDAVDVNYPVGSRFWWRLSQVAVKAERTMTLYFIDKIAAELMVVFGPKKADRARTTRAEFLLSLTKAVPGIEFYCRQLDKKQPIDPVHQSKTLSSGSMDPGLAKKTTGLGAYSGLKVLGKPMNQGQEAVVNLIIATADKLNAGPIATAAMVYAAIGETALGDNPNTYGNNGYGFTGVFQGSMKLWPDPHDIVGQATAFLQGGKGFHDDPGGAIKFAQYIGDPMEIAVRTEVPSIWPKNAYKNNNPTYMSNTDEVDQIVQAAGGAVGAAGSLEKVQQYNFEVGTAQDPQENYWVAMQRLSVNEVNWPLIVDGNRMYYDSEMTLITQKPAAEIDRDDPIVVTWDYNWEQRHIATQMTITLFADPFALRPGDVVVLKRFGPASECSSATPVALPGRWLVADLNPSDIGTLECQYVLKQPTAPKNEPAPTTKTVSGAADAVTSAQTAAQVLSGMSPSFTSVPGAAYPTKPNGYQWGGGHAPGSLDDVTHGATHGLDCSGAVCWTLKQAGMFPYPEAWTSGKLASDWGDPGEGKDMTVWANAGHTFIEFHAPGQPHAYLDTAANGPWYGYWPNSVAAGNVASNTFVPRHFTGTPTPASGIGSASPIAGTDKTQLSASDTYGPGRTAADIKLIVLHDSEIARGNLQGLFNTMGEVYVFPSGPYPGSDPTSEKKSIHFGVDGDGTAWRMCEDLQVAHHVYKYNPQSLGIEQLGFSTDTAWPAAQTDKAALLIANWARNYSIPIVHSITNGVCKHSDLGADGGNHSDPGNGYPFDAVLAKAQTL